MSSPALPEARTLVERLRIAAKSADILTCELLEQAAAALEALGGERGEGDLGRERIPETEEKS